MNAKTLLFAGLAAIGVVTAIGTALWIVAMARPAPEIAPAPILTTRYAAGRLAVTVALRGDDAIDRLGATARGVGLAMATGHVPTPGRIATVDLIATTPALHLVFDAAILTAGAISNQTPDHILGLAGEGSRWPAPAAVSGYCGRVETMRGDFCKRVRGE